MKKYNIFIILLFAILTSCGESEEWAEWKPVKLDIPDINVNSTDKLHLYGSVPAEGAEIIINGPKDSRYLEETCITKLHDLYVAKWHFPNDGYINGNPPFWGSDSWLFGEWWKVTYEEKEIPFKIKLEINPNPFREERVLEITFGGSAYSITTLTLTQSAAEI